MKSKIFVLIALLLVFSISYSFIHLNKAIKPQLGYHRGIEIAHASDVGGTLACGDCHVDSPSTGCRSCHNPPKIVANGAIKLWHHKQANYCENCHGTFNDITVPSTSHQFCNNCHSGFSHSG